MDLNDECCEQSWLQLIFSLPGILLESHWLGAILVSLLILFNLHSAVALCEKCMKRRPADPLECEDERRSAVDRPENATTASVCELVRCSDGGLPNTYDYGVDMGPHTWRAPENNQSPINIEQSCLIERIFDTCLEWGNYHDMPRGIRLENNGHTLILRASFADRLPWINGGDLLGRFEFREIRFRWSWYNSSGSEHTIDNEHFPLEMQCLHVDSDGDGCISSQALLMVSYMFELGNENPMLNVLTQHLVRVQSAGRAVEVPPFPLSYLLTPFYSRFFSYHGSLTEPPCHRGTEWFLCPLTFGMSERQLNEFRQLRNLRGGRILRNGRPVQPVGDRPVFLNIYCNAE